MLRNSRRISAWSSTIIIFILSAMDREIREVGVRCVSGGARELHPRLHGGAYEVTRMDAARSQCRQSLRLSLRRSLNLRPMLEGECEESAVTAEIEFLA